MKGESLQRLDEPGAALRLLLVVSSRPSGITVGTLYKFMIRLGVGRSMVDSSRRYLHEANLIVANSLRVEPRRTVKILSCTPLGLEIAKKIEEIDVIMLRASQAPT